MKKFIFFSVTFAAILSTSCLGGSSKDGAVSNSTVATDSNSETIGGEKAPECKYYSDLGYFNGIHLSPGQMPSDVERKGIAACSKGQFVFNGKCWDQALINDGTGEVVFTQGSKSVFIIKPKQELSAEVIDWVKSTHSLNNITCDGTSGCTAATNIYRSLWDIANYSVWGVHQLGFSQQSFEAPLIAADSDTIVLRTKFGSCYNDFGKEESYQYQWYSNGSINLNGSNFSFPLSKTDFLSQYPKVRETPCMSTHGTCFEIEKTWGKVMFYFDEKDNLFTYQTFHSTIN